MSDFDYFGVMQRGGVMGSNQFDSNHDTLSMIDQLFDNGLDNLTLVSHLLELEGHSDDEARDLIREAGYTGEVEHLGDRTFRVNMLRAH